MTSVFVVRPKTWQLPTRRSGEPCVTGSGCGSTVPGLGAEQSFGAAAASRNVDSAGGTGKAKRSEQLLQGLRTADRVDRLIDQPLRLHALDDGEDQRGEGGGVHRVEQLADAHRVADGGGQRLAEAPLTLLRPVAGRVIRLRGLRGQRVGEFDEQPILEDDPHEIGEIAPLTFDRSTKDASESEAASPETVAELPEWTIAVESWDAGETELII